MRQITVLAIGRMKDRALESLQQEYTKRLAAFCRTEIIEVRDEPNEHTERPGEVEQAKDREAARALEKIRPGDFVVLLDLHGTEWTSEQFSEKLASWVDASANVVFVIAGSLGPGKALVSRADVRWKLSGLTFTHLMTRVLLLEQIYRGFMIRAGRSYHK